MELTPNNSVESIHRTASDWAASPQVWDEMASHLPGDFDPNLRPMQAEADRLGAEQGRPSTYDIAKAVDVVLQYARKARNLPSRRTILVKTLDDLDQQVGVL